MSRICSYAFFRNEHSNYESEQCGVARGIFFVNYLGAVIRAHHVVWKDWDLHIFHDNRVMEFKYFDALRRMQDADLLKLTCFEESKTLTGLGGMLERMNPVFDWDVEYLVMRDLDSLPLHRDRKMVEQGLIGENALAHTIQDSVSHSGMMGGTLSLNCAKFRKRFECSSLEELIHRADGLHINWDKLGGDQIFLNSYIAPNLAGDWVIHSKKQYGSELCKTRLDVLPQACEADTLFNHVGGCGDAERAKAWYDVHYPNETILKAERDSL